MNTSRATNENVKGKANRSTNQHIKGNCWSTVNDGRECSNEKKRIIRLTFLDTKLDWVMKRRDPLAILGLLNSCGFLTLGPSIKAYH